MKREASFFWVFLSLFAMTFSASAADEGIQQIGEAEEIETGKVHDPIGFWIFFGGDAGYSGITTNNLSEFERDGFQVSIKGLGSFYVDDWVFDLGAGWNFNELGGNSASITTRSGIVELSPRYRLSEKWQIGPAMDLFFGPDVSLTSFAPYKNLTTLLGIKAVHEIPVFNDGWTFRLGGRIMTDVNLVNKQAIAGILDFTLGFPVSSQEREKDIIIKTAYEPTNIDPVIIRETAPTPGPVQINLREKEMRFATNSSELSSSARSFLRELGNYLDRNSENWEKLTVVGHTDPRGSFEYNLKLSERRALSVRTAIRQGGASYQKLSSLGKGPSEPLDDRNSPVAWSRNRRVELKFDGVTDSDKLREDIERIQIQTLWN